MSKRTKSGQIDHNGQTLKDILNAGGNLADGYIHPATHPVGMITGALSESQINTLVASRSSALIIDDVFLSGTMTLLIEDPYITEADCVVDIYPQDTPVGKWRSTYTDGSVTIMSTETETVDVPVRVEIRKSSGSLIDIPVNNANDYIHPATHPVSMITGALSSAQINTLIDSKITATASSTNGKLVSVTIPAGDLEIIYNDAFIVESTCTINVIPQADYLGVIDIVYINGSATITISETQAEDLILLLAIDKYSDGTPVPSVHYFISDGDETFTGLTKQIDVVGCTAATRVKIHPLLDKIGDWSVESYDGYFIVTSDTSETDATFWWEFHQEI